MLLPPSLPRNSILRQPPLEHTTCEAVEPAVQRQVSLDFLLQLCVHEILRSEQLDLGGPTACRLPLAALAGARRSIILVLLVVEAPERLSGEILLEVERPGPGGAAQHGVQQAHPLGVALQVKHEDPLAVQCLDGKTLLGSQGLLCWP